MAKNFKTSIKSHNRFAWAFISIMVLLLLVFMLYPIINSFLLSLTASRGIVSRFVGFDNYVRIVGDPMFWLALRNTLTFLVIQVPIMLLLALIMASLLNDKNLKGKSIFRTAIFLPAVTSLVAYTILFRMMFSFDGFINNALLSIGIIGEPIPWLLDPFWAQITLMIAMTWRWTGYNMVFYLSALQNIPDDLYEAACIDGANKARQFYYITLPMLRPLILFTTVMSTIGTLQLFDEPINLAQGGVTASSIGPGNSLLTLSVYIYNLSFRFMPNFGYAATVSYAIMFIAAVLSIIQFKVGGEEK